MAATLKALIHFYRMVLKSIKYLKLIRYCSRKVDFFVPKNIEKILRTKILDRTNLILDIFAQRAQTSYARTQVELAQYQYLLPRLAGMWTHLERQKGGIGMRGPGETEIETDRRIVRDRIALLKKKLTTIDKQMAIQRGNRGALVRLAYR